MKKFLSVFLILLCCFAMTACISNAKKKGYRANCDAFVAKYTGTTHETYDGKTYTVDGLSYKIHKWGTDNFGNLHLEIWWYIEVSGDYEPYKVLAKWQGMALEETEKVELDGVTYDTIYYDQGVDDNFTMILNNEYALNGNDAFEGRESITNPPLIPNSMKWVGVFMIIVVLIAGLGMLVYGWMQDPKKWLWILIGLGVIVGGTALAAFGGTDAAAYIGLALIPCLVVALLIWGGVRLHRKKQQDIIDFYLACKADGDGIFMSTAKNYGYSDEKKALNACLKGKDLYLRQQKREERRNREIHFSVPKVTTFVLTPIYVALLVVYLAVPQAQSAMNTIPLSMWIWILMMGGGAIWAIIFAIQHHVSGDARREAEEKQRRSEESSRMMAQLLAMKAQSGGDVVETLCEVSGYNKAVAEAEAREITNAAILGGAIGGVAGAVIGAETARQNIARRKGK